MCEAHETRHEQDKIAKAIIGDDTLNGFEAASIIRATLECGYIPRGAEVEQVARFMARRFILKAASEGRSFNYDAFFRACGFVEVPHGFESATSPGRPFR